MSEGEQLSISLSGGGPWGLRLQGGKDFGAPLTIARVTPAGKAAKSGVQPNDIITSINGHSTLSIVHLEAQQLVKNSGSSLALELIRGRDLIAHPLSVSSASSSASSVCSSPGPQAAAAAASSSARQAPPWQAKGDNAAPKTTATDGVDPMDLPPPPAFISNNTPPPTSVSPVVSTPQRAPAPWKQTAPGPQDQASPIPNEVAARARESHSPNGTGRRESRDDEVVLGGTFRRLQQQIEVMAVSDDAPASSLSPGGGASKVSSASSANGNSRRISSTSSAGRASPSHTASPVARGASPSSSSRNGPASPSVKAGLASSLAKLQASDNLQKDQKRAFTDGPSAAREDAAKRIGVSPGRVPTCGGCDCPINGPYVQALGKQWHAEHFVCSSCGTQLKGTPFVEHESKMFCQSCYTDFFASRCSECNKTITGECVSAGNKELHPACFRCVRCGSSLVGQGFQSQDGNFYCADDYEALFSVQCTGCQLPVKNNELWVEALGGQWHETCFACTVCQEPLQGGKFFAKLGRPYCKVHA